MRSALYEVDGVKNAEVSLASDDAVVIYDTKRVKVADLEKAIKESGYGVSGHSKPKPVEQAGEKRSADTPQGQSE